MADFYERPHDHLLFFFINTSIESCQVCLFSGLVRLKTVYYEMLEHLGVANSRRADTQAHTGAAALCLHRLFYSFIAPPFTEIKAGSKCSKRHSRNIRKNANSVLVSACFRGKVRGKRHGGLKGAGGVYFDAQNCDYFHAQIGFDLKSNLGFFLYGKRQESQ